jgi:hypothetical protein
MNQCKILGAKALDYKDFCKGVDLINQKSHLTIVLMVLKP